jgi:hypothetical protein
MYYNIMSTLEIQLSQGKTTIIDLEDKKKVANHPHKFYYGAVDGYARDCNSNLLHNII